MSSTPVRILMVEDSEADYELLALRLQEHGVLASLERVEDEPGMRAALAARSPDLVISDYQLPRFSVGDALRVLREHDPDTPLIVVSGAIGEEAAVQALLAGADDFIVKDNVVRLPAAIRRSIAAAETRRRQGRAESALRESEGLLRSLADNLPAMMFRLRYERTERVGERDTGRISLPYVGEGASRIFDLRPHRLRADPGLLLSSLAGEGGALLEARIAAGAAEGGDLSWYGRTVAGGLWVELRAKLRERDTTHALWDGIVFDVSGLKRAESEVRELTAHLENVKESERASAAREIHDDIGATFFGLKLDLAWLRKNAGGDASLAARLAAMEERLDAGIEASQRIVRSLRPAVLDFGVVGAAEWLVKDFRQRSGIAGEFASNVEELELDNDLGTALFRVLQESLTNVSRHAGATRVAVTLQAADGEVRLDVCDDGRGVAPVDLAKRTSFGVRGMRERARELGGAFELGPCEGGGTLLSLRLPLRYSGADEQP